MSSDEDYDDYDDEYGGGEPFWSRWAIVSGVVVATIVLLGGYVLWPSGGGGDEKSDNTAGTRSTTTLQRGGSGGGGSTSPPTEVEEPPVLSECPTDRGTNDRIPPPVDGTVTWNLYAGYAFPTSTLAGPLRIEDSGMAHCFERSPSGAVLAATNVGGRILVSQSRAELVREQVVDGPVKTQVLERFDKPDGDDPEPIDNLCQTSAYKVVSYTKEEAVVTVATTCGANDIRANDERLRWVDEDWKIVYPDEFTPGGPPKRVASLDGFTEFRGVVG